MADRTIPGIRHANPEADRTTTGMISLPKIPRRVVILKPSALGDIAHAVPVLSALRELFPSSHITWVVNRSFEPLLTGHPDLNATLPFDRGVFKRNPIQAAKYSLQFSNLLRRNRFDCAIDLQGLLRTGLMTAATAASVRIGFANSREGSRHFYTHRIEVPNADQIHAVDRYWRVVEALGGAALPKRFVLPVQASETALVNAELAEYPRPWVALAPGARWLTKRWAIAAFAALANRATVEFGGTILLVGAPDDIALSAELRQQLTGPVFDYTGKTSISKMVAVLNNADAMVSNDTGPLHVAAACGVPCVAPFLCTKPIRHGPYNSHSGAVSTSVACAGSYLRLCPHGQICLGELTPDKLWPPLEQVLRTWRRS
jgi:heptosyltransferase I